MKSKTIKIKTIASFFLVALILLLSNCKADNGEPDQKKITFWKSEATGYILKIVGNDHSIFSQYSQSSAGCTLIGEDIAASSLGITLNKVSDDLLTISSPLLIGEISFKKLSEDEESCITNHLLKTDDPKVNYGYFWNLFNDYYSSFEQRNADWDAFKGYQESVNSENLNEAIEEAITSLKDAHVSVRNENGFLSSDGEVMLQKLNEFLSPALKASNGDDVETLLSEKGDIIISEYLNDNIGTDKNRNMAYGMVFPGVGYLNILSMQDYGSTPMEELSGLHEAMDEVMSAIAENNVTKLIIDIRFNTGGYDQVALAIASYFFDQNRHVLTKKSRVGNGYGDEFSISVSPSTKGTFTGEIVLLTSPRTVSAAEVFTMSMKTLPYVTLVGQATNGAFSDILTHRLPNGTIVNLSNQVYLDAENNNFEGRGISPKPENVVPFLITSDFTNKADSGIDKALSILN